MPRYSGVVVVVWLWLQRWPLARPNSRTPAKARTLTESSEKVTGIFPQALTEFGEPSGDAVRVLGKFRTLPRTFAESTSQLFAKFAQLSRKSTNNSQRPDEIDQPSWGHLWATLLEHRVGDIFRRLFGFVDLGYAGGVLRGRRRRHRAACGLSGAAESSPRALAFEGRCASS